jgi:hypothetical protein
MSDEAKAESNCTMSGPAYRIKVRAEHRAFQYMGEMIDQEWREMPVLKHQGIGVSIRNAEHEVTFTYPYHAAVALAAWFVNETHGMAQAKLIEYKMIVKTELWKEGELELEDAIGFMFKKAIKDNPMPSPANPEANAK